MKKGTVYIFFSFSFIQIFAVILLFFNNKIHVVAKKYKTWPRGVVVSVLTTHVRGAGFDSRPG